MSVKIFPATDGLEIIIGDIKVEVRNIPSVVEELIGDPSTKKLKDIEEQALHFITYLWGIRS